MPEKVVKPCTVLTAQGFSFFGSPQPHCFIPQMPLRLSGSVARDGYAKQIKDLGDRLRVRRLDLGLTQAEVAVSIGVSVDTVTNWERGHMFPRRDLRLTLIACLKDDLPSARDEGLEAGGPGRRDVGVSKTTP